MNTRGELVGINTGIYTQSGGYQGVGFAVASNLARHVVDELMKYGSVQRGTVDFLVDRLTPELAQEVGATSTKGAVVTRMYRDSPSYDAGLRPGDVVVGYNGKPIDDVSQLKKLIADSKIGSTATFKVARDGRTIDVRIPIVASSASRRRRQ
jgi:S1-C subfamily serine protease